MNETQTVCRCSCHFVGDPDAVGCTVCEREDRILEDYYLSETRTARSIIEGLAQLGEKARKFLERKE